MYVASSPNNIIKIKIKIATSYKNWSHYMACYHWTKKPIQPTKKCHVINQIDPYPSYNTLIASSKKLPLTRKRKTEPKATVFENKKISLFFSLSILSLTNLIFVFVSGNMKRVFGVKKDKEPPPSIQDSSDRVTFSWILCLCIFKEVLNLDSSIGFLLDFWHGFLIWW